MVAWATGRSAPPCRTAEQLAARRSRRTRAVDDVPNGISAGSSGRHDCRRTTMRAAPGSPRRRRPKRREQRDEEERDEIDEVALVDPRQVDESRRRARVAAGGVERRRVESDLEQEPEGRGDRDRREDRALAEGSRSARARSPASSAAANGITPTAKSSSARCWKKSSTTRQRARVRGADVRVAAGERQLAAVHGRACQAGDERDADDAEEEPVLGDRAPERAEPTLSGLRPGERDEQDGGERRGHEHDELKARSGRERRSRRA